MAIDENSGAYKSGFTRRVNSETKVLTKIFHAIEPEMMPVAHKLIEKLAFMAITMQELEKTIKDYGPVYWFRNGKQEMLIENPAQRSYNTLVSRYSTLYNQLFAMMPKDEEEAVIDDGFDALAGERE